MSCVTMHVTYSQTHAHIISRRYGQTVNYSFPSLVAALTRRSTMARTQDTGSEFTTTVQI